VKTLRGAAAIALAAFAGLVAPADAQTLSLVGASTMICQLTGDTDWSTSLPIAAQTNARFGLGAVDFPLPMGALAPLRAAAEQKGRGDFTPLWSGQAVALSREMPAAMLFGTMVEETIERLHRRRWQ